jgi:YfiH family protein
MDRHQFSENNKKGLVYYTIPSFEDTGLVRHSFSSRLGGVSTGECSSLNLGFKRKDNEENVRENFRLFCKSIGVNPSQMVFTDQVHKDKIEFVTESHTGMGFMRPSGLKETDGLITDRPGVALVTFYADCVPLFFLDPVHKAIGLSHSGWRGTVAKIGVKTLKAMKDNFGTKAEDCLVGIGPSIGKCCFEVDPPVAHEFSTAFPGHENALIEARGAKYHVDLWEANRIQLKEAGVRDSNITVSKLCTCCNKDTFFSHRGDKGRTGSLAAILMLV